MRLPVAQCELVRDLLACTGRLAPAAMESDGTRSQGGGSGKPRRRAVAESAPNAGVDGTGDVAEGDCRDRASSTGDESLPKTGATRLQRLGASLRAARRLSGPYMWRGVMPCLGLLALAAATSAAGYRSMWAVRLILFVLAFVVARDALIPCGLWSIGGRGRFGRRFFWMHFVFNAPILWGLGLSGIAVPYLMNWIEPSLAAHIVNWREPWFPACLAGLALGVVAAYPALVVNQRFGGTGPAHVMDPVRTTNPKAIWFQPATRGAMIFFVVAGACCACAGVRGMWLCRRHAITSLTAGSVVAWTANYLEEVLFRGYIRGLCVTMFGMGTWGAIIFSAAAFAVLHVWLAFVLTDVGLPILVFTFWEGVVSGVAEVSLQSRRAWRAT